MPVAWKVYGTDLNGKFGGLQGTGGLEATIVDSGGATKGVINDQFGNGVASVSGSTLTWFATRAGGYGPLPGTAAETLTDITRVAEATAWRSRRIDPTGFYNLGARYFESTSGRFLSADPMGHGVSPSLYDFCSGDPVNFFDPDGRCKNRSYGTFAIGFNWSGTLGLAASQTNGLVFDSHGDFGLFQTNSFGGGFGTSEGGGLFLGVSNAQGIENYKSFSSDTSVAGGYLAGGSADYSTAPEGGGSAGTDKFREVGLTVGESAGVSAQTFGSHTQVVPVGNIQDILVLPENPVVYFGEF